MGLVSLLLGGFSHKSHPLLLLLLNRVLFSLAIAAAEALGSKTLVAKRGPRAKVLATFAPLDLETGGSDDPHVHIAERAETLVLSWNHGHLLILRSGLDIGVPGCQAAFHLLCSSLLVLACS